ncbi:MAG: FadR family transcriptional regulator [Deltaproteobacteria bacterium]|nr:FadR family transcriptional regulator [Deltaproteobacteria bacterium]MBW2153395.1 FadR family transcriptional regulator [Deltaproteobacteria bacterium]
MNDLQEIKLSSGAGLPQQVAEHLSGEIHDGVLKTGQKLPPEAELCKKYGVSRTVIREAVARLKHDGLLESRQGSGVTVASWENRRAFRLDGINMKDPFNINFIYEMRVLIGVEAVALAAIRHKEEDLERLNHLMGEMAEAIRKGEDGAVSHRAFHKSLAEASYNPYLIDFESFLQERLWEILKQARKRTQTTPGLAQKVHKEHQLIIDGIASRVPSLAREAARHHLHNAAKRAGVRIYHPL